MCIFWQNPKEDLLVLKHHIPLGSSYLVIDPKNKMCIRQHAQVIIGVLSTHALTFFIIFLQLFNFSNAFSIKTQFLFVDNQIKFGLPYYYFEICNLSTSMVKWDM
jgi:hypothetical protein